MSGWLPIESAPKDGTRIIVTAIHPVANACVGEAFGFQDAWWWASGDPTADRFAKPIEATSRVTHWMPLPDPPQ